MEVLLGAGFDAVLFCNENDRPYQLRPASIRRRADPRRHRVQARRRAVRRRLPVGRALRLAVAAATGASFIREVATGAWESDMGLWSPDAAQLLRERRRLDVTDLAVS